MAGGRKLLLAFIIGGFIILFLLFFIIGIAGMSSTEGGLWSGFGDKIAIVDIKGEISESEEVVSQLRKYGNDSSIKGILVRIDSPGGGVGASQEIYGEILRIRDLLKKPVVISMGSVAASGGYYISCAGDFIFANPGTLTGSIGVILQYAVAKELLDKVGVQFRTIKSGRIKDVGSPYRWPTEADSLMLQAMVDNSYNQFVDIISERRQLDREEVLKIADGSVFTGQQAMALGLVDTLGGYEDAVAYLASAAGISGEPRRIKQKEKKEHSILDILGGAAGEYLTLTKNSGPRLLYLFR